MDFSFSWRGPDASPVARGRPPLLILAARIPAGMAPRGELGQCASHRLLARHRLTLRAGGGIGPSTQDVPGRREPCGPASRRDRPCVRATCAAKLISCARQHGGRLDASRRREHFSDGVESPGKSELLLHLAHQGQALLQQLAAAGVISFRARYVSEAEQHELSLIHISEPTRLRRMSYAVFCLKK